jgi:hypothetical protein
MKVSEVLEMLKHHSPDDEIVIAFWTRDLFGDSILTKDGEELDECPKDAWNAVAGDYALQEWEVSAIHEDITYAIQSWLDTEGGE